MCSDGLSDMIGDEEIAAILSGSTGRWIRWPGSLVGAANNAGGRDNISVLLVQAKEAYDQTWAAVQNAGKIGSTDLP